MEGLIATGQRRLKSLDDYRSNWRTHTGPVFADRAAAKVTAEEARTFLAQIAKHNSGNIHNKCLTLMKRLYNFGIEERLVEANPFSRFKEKPETERERFIQSHEIKAFLESVAQEPQVYQDVCMMLLLTAQRKSCVFSMHWKEVDFFNKLWIIPSAKMKAHKGHSVPLTEEALSILQRRSKDRHESGYVFPSDRSDKGYITDKSGKSGFWRRITERAGLYSEDKSQRVTVHDVRRTVGSWQAMIGEPILNISKTLGHADIRTTSSVYAHLCTKEVRGSLERSTEALLKAGEVIRQEPTLADLLIERVRAMDEEEQLALWGYLLKQERAGTPLTLIKG
jgi:integrase